jgi:hypothetical protein
MRSFIFYEGMTTVRDHQGYAYKERDGRVKTRQNKSSDVFRKSNQGRNKGNPKQMANPLEKRLFFLLINQILHEAVAECVGGRCVVLV